MIERVLRKMKEGGTIDTLAKALDMRKSTVQAMIEFMIRDGYLKEIEIGCGNSSECGGCPLKCEASPVEGMKMKMYVVTEKGMERIKV